MIQTKIQNRKRLTDLENELTVARLWGIFREFGKVMYPVLYSKWITNKDSQEGSQRELYSVSPGCLDGFGGEWIHVYTYGWVPILLTRNYRNIVNRLYPHTKRSLKFKKQNLLPNTGLTTAPSSPGEIRCRLTCHPHEPTPFLRGPFLDSSKKAWVNLYLGQESISIQTHLPKSACPLGSHRRTKSLSQGFPSII